MNVVCFENFQAAPNKFMGMIKYDGWTFRDSTSEYTGHRTWDFLNVFIEVFQQSRKVLHDLEICAFFMKQKISVL